MRSRALVSCSLCAALAACGGRAETIATGSSTAVTSASATAGVRYLALGDSFTIGTGSSPAEAFPARLVTGWTGCSVELTNVAKNGYTSGDVVERELSALERVHPTFVTIAVGANDIVAGVPEARYRENVSTIFAAVRAAGVAPDHVVALPQPDWSISPAAIDFGTPEELRAHIERENAILAEEAKAAGARYVDLWPTMRAQADAKELASDGLHPSAKAHAAWARALGDALGPCRGFGR